MKKKERRRKRGKLSIFFFEAPEKNKQSNPEHNKTRNISCSSLKLRRRISNQTQNIIKHAT